MADQLAKLSFNVLLETVTNRFGGTWKRKVDFETIECCEKANLLECKFLDESSESFVIEGIHLRGTINRMIRGRLTQDDVILWNTGNHWLKEGA